MYQDVGSVHRQGGPEIRLSYRKPDVKLNVDPLLKIIEFRWNLFFFNARKNALYKPEERLAIIHNAYFICLPFSSVSYRSILPE